MSSTNRGRARHRADNYPTPSWCVRRLLEVVALPREGRWLEPCAGDGAIIRATPPGPTWTAMELRPECEPLLEPMVGAAQTHLGDFLASPPSGKFDVVLTNPPYGSAQAFVEQARRRADHVVMLLRLNFLASATRAPFMRETLPDVYVLPNRPSFTGKGTDSIEYAWFHWHDHGRPAGWVRVLADTSVAERRRG